MIALDRRAGDAFLEKMERDRIVDLGGVAVPGKIGARPVIDEIVAERPQRAIGQMVTGLLPEIEQIDRRRDSNKAARERDRQVR